MPLLKKKPDRTDLPSICLCTQLRTMIFKFTPRKSQGRVSSSGLFSRTSLLAMIVPSLRQRCQASASSSRPAFLITSISSLVSSLISNSGKSFSVNAQDRYGQPSFHWRGKHNGIVPEGSAAPTPLVGQIAAFQYELPAHRVQPPILAGTPDQAVRSSRTMVPCFAESSVLATCSIAGGQ
jgi:hypothetical protein